MEREEPNKVLKRGSNRVSKQKEDKRNMIEIIQPALQQMLTVSWILVSNNKISFPFITPLLKKAIPKNGKFQRLGNAIFVFEMVNLETLCLVTKVIPGDKKTRAKILSALSGLDSLYKTGVEDDLTIHVWHKTNLTAVDFIGKEKDEIKEILKKDWDIIIEKVKKVEKELLKYFKINISPLSKDTRKIRTYLKIIDFLRESNEKGFYPKVADMVEHLAKLDENAPKKRLIQRYISELKTDFHIYIDQKEKRGGYEIKLNEMNTNNNFIEIYESFRILENAGYFKDIFDKSKESLQYIHFDGKQFTGYRHIKTILNAIMQSRVIKIMHKKFEGEQNERKVNPCLLKQYSNRWYLVGHDYKNEEMRTFGLDRIDKIEITEETFDNTKTAQVKDSFKDVIGVVYNNPTEEVVLKFENDQINYFRTYPWHKSAKIEKNEKGEWIAHLHVSINYELKQLILMNHSFVQVLKPKHLADSVKDLLKEALKKYG